MSVERRRIIALIGTIAIVIAIGAGVYLIRDGVDEAAVGMPPVAQGQGPVEEPEPAQELPRADAPREAAPQPEPETEALAEAPAPQAAEPDPAPAGMAAIDPAVATALPQEAAPVIEATFDIVRVEPTGDAVIAGRAAPGSVVELLRDGEPFAVEVADAAGNFVFIAPPLPPGAHEIGLQVRGEDGLAARSRQSVTVVIDAGGDTPIVALAQPDRPTLVLSQPEPAPAAPPVDVALVEAQTAIAAVDGTQEEAAAESALAESALAEPALRPGIRIASVEAETAGSLFVSGSAAPRAQVRLYLNETLVGTAVADGTGTVSFAIRRGVRPGDYRVRLDDVDVRDGSVLSRAEVLFAMPAIVAETAQQMADGSVALDVDGEEIVERAATLTIPEVATALVARGDSLWRISRRVYGSGIRYTVIYEANAEQIRNPNLIFPGQVFVLPVSEEEAATRVDLPGEPLAEPPR